MMDIMYEIPKDPNIGSVGDHAPVSGEEGRSADRDVG